MCDLCKAVEAAVAPRRNSRAVTAQWWVVVRVRYEVGRQIEFTNRVECGPWRPVTATNFGSAASLSRRLSRWRRKLYSSLCFTFALLSGFNLAFENKAASHGYKGQRSPML
jgi:hypothetical protein